MAECNGIVFKIGKLGRIINGVEVVSQRNTQRVAKMPVQCLRLAKRSQQRSNMTGVRPPGQRIGGSTADLL